MDNIASNDHSAMTATKESFGISSTSSETENTLKESTAQEKPPRMSENTSIDADAIKRAMKNMQLKSQKQFDQWTQRIYQKNNIANPVASSPPPIPTKLAPLSSLLPPPQATGLNTPTSPKKSVKTIEKCTVEHDIIPATPLRAFHRTTQKAIQSTVHLSRPATMAESLYRLYQNPKLQNYITETNTLTIHLIGVDHVECATQATICAALGPLTRWMSSSLLTKHLENIHFKLLGPNVPPHAHQQWSSANPLLLHKMGEFYAPSLKEATVVCETCVYHDYLDQLSKMASERSDEINSLGLAIAFNAGIYGYTEWEPTLQRMACFEEKEIPFVVTSYTMEEAEDDAEVIENILGLSSKSHETDADSNNVNQVEDDANCKSGLGKYLWEVEPNPYASRKQRNTATAIGGRCYFENGAWQCWLLGGIHKGADKNNTD